MKILAILIAFMVMPFAASADQDVGFELEGLTLCPAEAVKPVEDLPVIETARYLWDENQQQSEDIFDMPALSSLGGGDPGIGILTSASATITETMIAMSDARSEGLEFNGHAMWPD